MAQHTLKLTRAAVDGLRHANGQRTYWDTELRGFGVSVNATCKTYVVQRTVGSRVQGTRRTIKMTIGRHGVYMTDEARREAREILSQFARGEDPRAAKRAGAARSITLRQAWTQYKSARPLGSQASRDYARAVEKHLAVWLDRPLCTITGAEVVQLHTEYSRPDRLGPSVAAKTMRIFRAIYNFAEVANENLPRNPADRLTKLRLWYRDRRRTGYIQPDQMASWYNAVMNLHSDAGRDYMRLILFTGMRRSEAASLTWTNIDFARRIFMVPITKNGDPLVMPMSSFVFKLLRERRSRTGDSEFVFPAESAKGFLQEPKKWVAEVARNSGVKVTLHDLRRTFATVAETINVGQRTIQRLLNHRPGREALTNYVVFGVEQLREPIEKIALFMERAATQSNSVQQFYGNTPSRIA